MQMIEGAADRLAGQDDFAEAYRRHHARTAGLALLLCGDREVAADIAAEAWVGAYRRLARHPIDDIGPYVRRAVVNGVRDRARRRVLAGVLPFLHAGQPTAVPSAEAQVTDRDELLAALAQLPQRMRTAVVLRYFDDRSVEETAALMGVSEGTVKSTTSKGLAKLRHLLEGTR